MDAKDVRILCEMAFKDLGSSELSQRHISPTEIGKKLGLDEKTVRLRMSRMEDDGFIKYYQAMPSLALFGLGCLTLYRFEAMNLLTKQRVLNSVKEIPGILEAFDYLGPTVSIDIAGETESQVKTAADAIAGRFELTELALGTRTIRNPDARPDRLDWQLIQKLRYDARIPTTEIAKSLGITPRMAEYKIGKLLDAGALLIRARINTQRQAGLIFYELELSVDDGGMGRAIEKLRERNGEKLWSVSSPSSGLVLANLFGFTLAEPEDSALAALEFEGVGYCHLHILKEVVEPPKASWVDALIEQKLEA